MAPEDVFLLLECCLALEQFSHGDPTTLTCGKEKT